MKRFVLFFATLWLGVMGASAQGYHYDVNNDGSVNIADATLVVNKVLGKDNPGDEPVVEAVDLGLPSGTLWANCNIGASKPEEYGNHYAWGETGTKSDYSEESYQFCQNGSYVNIGIEISGTQYDVASALWGDGWRMPTEDEFQELMENCTSEWTTVNGVNGYKFTSTNGNSVFLPAAGLCYGSGLWETGNEGYYWSSTKYPDGSSYFASYDLFFFSDGDNYGDHYDRCYGFSIRPVRSSGAPKPQDVYVDLGLPSGTMWATCNIGANSPEEFGDYYAWGETGTKLKYNADTYLFTQEDEYYGIIPTSLGDNIDGISGSKYDVARMKLGGKWRIPKAYDIMELFENCTSEWTTLNGVNGRKFTSRINGNSIFLPAAGYRMDGELKYANLCGYYWSSMLYPTEGPFDYYSRSIYFSSDDAYYDGSDHSRIYGQTVRPVISE